MPKKGTLRVWHIPQVPCKAYRKEVKDLESAALLLDVLAEYDLFQFENRIKPTDREAPDYPMLMEEFIIKLSKMESRDPLSLVRDILL